MVLLKRLAYIDEGSNDINHFLYFFENIKLIRIFLDFFGLLATMHPIFLYTKFTFIFNYTFSFLM